MESEREGVLYLDLCGSFECEWYGVDGPDEMQSFDIPGYKLVYVDENTIRFEKNDTEEQP